MAISLTAQPLAAMTPPMVTKTPPGKMTAPAMTMPSALATRSEVTTLPMTTPPANVDATDEVTADDHTPRGTNYNCLPPIFELNKNPKSHV